MAESNTAVAELPGPEVAAQEEVDAVAFERDRTANVFQRLNLIMADLRPLSKDKEVEINAKSKYSYISHDAVSLAVRPLLAKHGVMVVPTVAKRLQDGNRTEVDVKVTFVNVDKPEDRMDIDVFGYGVDPSDKGPGKALSYAMKYAYLKVFCLNAGDDIEEQDAPHERHDVVATAKMEQTETQRKAAIQAAANNLKLAIQGAKSLDELKALQKANKDVLMSFPDVTKQYFIDLIESRKDDFPAPDAET